ncbi:hypothetical protein EDD85DRAFT_951742 [Armillaria nabsnona]|nr:hypothetical protein EDD85DRAFT_951742 [Armillaria nabsnona]
MPRAATTLPPGRPIGCIQHLSQVKKFKGRTPSSSDPPSCDEPKTDLKEAPKTQMHKEAKDLCPASTTRTCSPRFRLPLTRLGKQAWCAYIAPESTYLNEDSSNEKFASVLAVLKSFDHVIEQLNDINVHFLPSIITMQSGVHEWLPDHHAIQSTSPRKNIYRSRQREPPRSILALHATVALLSGAAEYIDKQDRTVEDLGVLWKFSRGIEQCPVEEHESTYTTSAKPLSSSASSSSSASASPRQRLFPLCRQPLLR